MLTDQSLLGTLADGWLRGALPDRWLFGLLAASLLLHLLLIYQAYRLRRPSDHAVANPDGTQTPVQGSAENSVGVDDGAATVTCPRCDAENEAGYRYCHACVNELPGAVAASTVSDSPRSRFAP